MSSSSLVPALLSAASSGQPSRASSAVVAKAARGFQVFRVDGYSWTNALPGGERITSEQFTVGGRIWQVDYYPNAHAANRMRAQYKFSLLDLDGNAAYELPAETGIFVSDATRRCRRGGQGEEEEEKDPAGCGYACFITKEDLEKRRGSLLRDDCIAIRCDVGVTEVSTAGGVKQGRPRQRYGYYGYDNGDDDGSHEGRRRSQGPPSDKEFIRQCLSARRRN
ncbi:hypothetical protein BS78_07G048600 [Paspalum vaginatum]|nr:hypothetical protein BS78_07G048600 [Paspalum vaginatum]